MNVQQIFNEQDSGLVGIMKNNESVYVSAAKQKAFFELNERGSEAAAANGMILIWN